MEIFDCVEKLLGSDFTRTNSIQIKPVPEKLIRSHYENIKGKPFYDWTIKAFLESREGIILRGYKGNNIVERMRIIAGHTDPQKADSGTIRAIFSNDSLDIAFKEKRYLNNIIHASSSVENAVREIKLWRDFLYEWTC